MVWLFEITGKRNRISEGDDWHYNLRGDVIVTTDDAGNVLSQSYYEAYGEHKDSGAMPSDKHRANTKVEDADTSLLLEGHRYRLIGAGIFLSPDPLEYVDGLHRYAYCGFNPWGRFDPTGLEEDDAGTAMRKANDAKLAALRILDPKAANEAQKKIKETSKDVRSIPQKTASAVVDQVPVAGTVKSGVELVTGEDPFTGEKISKTAAAVGLVAGMLGEGGPAKRSLKSAMSDAAETFFEGAAYSEKVQRQMKNLADKHHAFPMSVDGFAKDGKVSIIKGKDGKNYQKLEIKGNYNGKDGVFEYIKNENGEINHRQFVPNKG